MNKKGIAKEIRRISKAEGSCYVCDYPDTQTHHIVKVSVLTGLVLRMQCELNKLIIPVVALCPNHHHKLHVLMEDINGDMSTTEHEKEKYEEIVNMADYMENDYYNESVDRMKDTVFKNLER